MFFEEVNFTNQQEFFGLECLKKPSPEKITEFEKKCDLIYKEEVGAKDDRIDLIFSSRQTLSKS